MTVGVQVAGGLACRVAGLPSRPCILFIHGGGISGWMWRPQVEVLSSDFFCLAPDLPGHGASRDLSPFTLTGAAERLAELIRAKAGGGRAHVVGLSLGGQIALELLRMAPGVIDRMVVSGTSVRPLFGRSFIGPLVRATALLARYQWYLRANFKQSNISDEYFPPFQEDSRMPPEALVRVLRESLSFRLPPALPGTGAHALVMAGEREPAAVRRSLAEIRRALPDATIRLAPRLGHLWNLQAPGLFTDAVRAWLQGRPLPEGLQTPRPVGT